MAVVVQAPASEPAMGSVRQKAANFFCVRMSEYICFWVAVPARRTGLMARPVAPMVVANPASTLPISSQAAATVI